MIKKTLGGDRLGSGRKMQVEMHGYDRSTFDLSYLFRTTMSMGTLVPFMVKVGLPGDTFDIDLQMEINTHPTVGPLFGSAKVQADVFLVPIRLYNALIHNNKLNIGLTMNQVYLPKMTLQARTQDLSVIGDPDNCQINPSCVLKYLGISGIGNNNTGNTQDRDFNATSLIGLWDIYKNYYANKQEGVGAVIHNAAKNPVTVTGYGVVNSGGSFALPSTTGIYVGRGADLLSIGTTGSGTLNPNYFAVTTSLGELNAADAFINWHPVGAGSYQGNFNVAKYGQLDVYSVRELGATDGVPVSPQVQLFPLENIDLLREDILASQSTTSAYNLSGFGQAPYSFITNMTNDALENRLSSQEGLPIKTYQSDLFNNWLQTEFIDGPTGINEITAIDVSGGTLEINQLILAKKVYNLLNRIAVSGGSYDDWLETVYANGKPWVASTPMYVGGLIKELVFQEVVSNSSSDGQPLGTLAGRGRFNDKHKGGRISVKVQEPSYIIGLASITPRIDYSQGNNWDTYALKTFNDFHMPQMDEIGFQDLITEQMAFWDTEGIGTPAVWTQKSAGKQPAWVNYMTAVNKCYGNFAIKDNEMFMTFNRRYEIDGSSGIADLTTYIDPVKYNYIFADTALDAQNYWLQIGVGIEARRVMSAKLMPNL